MKGCRCLRRFVFPTFFILAVLGFTYFELLADPPILVNFVPFTFFEDDPALSEAQNRARAFKTLDSLFEALSHDYRLKINWPEAPHLLAWYQELRTNEQERFRSLVSAGQFFPVPAPFSSSSALFADHRLLAHEITQQQLALQREFNFTSRAVLDLHSRGASAGLVALYEALGVEVVIAPRISFPLKSKMKEDRSMSVLWRTHSNSEGVLFVTTPFEDFFVPQEFVFRTQEEL